MRSRKWKKTSARNETVTSSWKSVENGKREKDTIEIIGARENILPLSNISTIEVVAAASGPAFERASAAYVEVQPLFPITNNNIWHLKY